MNKKKIACIQAQFNKEITDELFSEAKKAFSKYVSRSPEEFLSQYPATEPLDVDKLTEAFKGLKDWEIDLYKVPGSGEIPTAARPLLEEGKAEALLGLGCVIKGETSHYDFLVSFLSGSLVDLQNICVQPICFSILMTENRELAKKRIQRAGETMNSLLDMILFRESL